MFDNLLGAPTRIGNFLGQAAPQLGDFFANRVQQAVPGEIGQPRQPEPIFAQDQNRGSDALRQLEQALKPAKQAGEKTAQMGRKITIKEPQPDGSTVTINIDQPIENQQPMDQFAQGMAGQMLPQQLTPEQLLMLYQLLNPQPVM